MAAWRWFCGLFHAGEPVATRVGLLNTGELVLVSPCGQAQVLTEATTGVIRLVLETPNVTHLEARLCRSLEQPLPPI